jgi:gas vesicle protein
MKDDKGKVIFSLLAGATAGVVAGLLLAPETGDQVRAGLRRSASKWSGDLSRLMKDTLAKVQGGAGHTNPDAAVSEDKDAADRLLQGLSGGTAAGYSPSEADSDYDGSGSDAWHRGDVK